MFVLVFLSVTLTLSPPLRSSQVLLASLPQWAELRDNYLRQVKVCVSLPLSLSLSLSLSVFVFIALTNPTHPISLSHHCHHRSA